MRYVIFAFTIAPCFAQVNTLRVFSELTRIDPFGEIVSQDRGKVPPRTILSPGVPRNAFSSLRIAVTLDKPTKVILDIAQNPDNAVKPTLYKEKFEKHGNQWIPDGLEPVKIPYEAELPDGQIPGQKTVTFWLDMWVDRSAPVDRIKVEPQLWVSYADDWFIYPMEVRILSSVLPDVKVQPAQLPAITDRSDAAVLGPLRAAVCGAKEKPGEELVSARALIRRNALEYLTAQGRPLNEAIPKTSGARDLKAWCSARTGSEAGPEWLLKLRDLLIGSNELRR